ncbi:hypothetical protein DWV16_05815 [Anaerotruncus sp. AF02-27]|nr:hypothetical protein DWV16_05815 [Anaerotruncus sp. AF02-27]
MRHNLNHIDEADQLLRRKEIYEELHPDTRPGGDRKSESFKRKQFPFDSTKSFAADTAAKTGITERAVRGKIQIAKNLTSASVTQSSWRRSRTRTSRKRRHKGPSNLVVSTFDKGYGQTV